jgi:methionine-S-sulfoxide reductase
MSGVTGMNRATLQRATFAGGCFWCMEPEFAHVPGVHGVISGYTGGQTQHPTYEQVCAGATGHIEAIEVTFDPAAVSYAKLLEIFWRNIDPLDPFGQFADKGSQYRAGIFTHDEPQKALAEHSKTTAGTLFGRPVACFIRPAEKFWPAEDYHQQYYIKSRARYKQYAEHNGRKERLRTVWAGKTLTLASWRNTGGTP